MILLTSVFRFLLVILFLQVSSSYANAQAGHTQRITAMAMNKDGKLISASVDGTLILWDMMARKTRSFNRPKDQYSETVLMVPNLDFLQDGKSFLVKGLSDGYIGHCDNSTLTSLNTGFMRTFNGIAITADGKYLLADRNDNSGIYIGSMGGVKHAVVPDSFNDLYPFPKDSKKFLAISPQNGMKIFDVDGICYGKFPELKRSNLVIAIAPDDNGFFYGNTFYSIQGIKNFTLPDVVERVVFSPDGKTIFTSNGNKITAWSSKGERLFFLDLKVAISSFLLTPSGDAIVIGDFSGKIEMFTLDGKSIFQYK